MAVDYTDMGRQPGDGRGRLGGRGKDTPNKDKRELREALKPIMYTYFTGIAEGADTASLTHSFAEDLQNMTPVDRARCLTGMAPFVMPRLQAIEVNEKKSNEGLKEELSSLNKVVGEDDDDE